MSFYDFLVEQDRQYDQVCAAQTSDEEEKDQVAGSSIGLPKTEPEAKSKEAKQAAQYTRDTPEEQWISLEAWRSRSTVT